MTKTSTTEFDTGRKAQLRVTRKFGLSFTVVHQVLGWEMAAKGWKKVLGGHPMTGLIENGVIELLRLGVTSKKREQKNNLGDGVEGTLQRKEGKKIWSDILM